MRSRRFVVLSILARGCFLIPAGVASAEPQLAAGTARTTAITPAPAFTAADLSEPPQGQIGSRMVATSPTIATHP